MRIHHLAVLALAACASARGSTQTVPPVIAAPSTQGTTAAERDSMLAIPSPDRQTWCRAERPSFDTTRLVVQVGLVGDTGGWHEMVVVFDSMGAAEMIAVHHESPRPATVLHNRGFVAHVSGVPLGTWAAQDDRGSPPRSDVMSLDGLTRARALAAWVRNRGCGRSP